MDRKNRWSQLHSGSCPRFPSGTFLGHTGSCKCALPLALCVCVCVCVCMREHVCESICVYWRDVWDI